MKDNVKTMLALASLTYRGFGGAADTGSD